VIAIVDYGGGNVGSVLKAVKHSGHEAQVVSEAADLSRADKIILPGQGHFGAMMNALTQRSLLSPLRNLLSDGKPYLGICLGLQALYQSSDEAPGIAGLGFLSGTVTRFAGVFKIPQVGWNQLEVRGHSKLLDGISNGSFVYYCHSYYGPVTEHAVAITEYGQTYAAAVELGSIWAVQFHPEKSSDVGLRVVQNFLQI